VYALPKIPGNHVAQLKESYNIKGLITATYLPHKKKLLSGYSKCCPHFYLLRLQQQQLFRQRKIKIALPFHQVEVSLPRWLHYYLTNENFVRKPILIARNNCTALI
jgi:hypothetical protein